MKTRRSAFILCESALLVALALALPACQTDPQRLARLEAAQQEQARELASLRQRLAEKEAEVAQLETCVNDLENAVYEDEDSTAYDDDYRPGLTQL
ncbi:hypothetical protein [Hymenobacter negativus]|uniref:Uncharacterized protein n=1 Tax=Hymenobacter negativus TaxID=2795026 RepID=A0ABS3QGL7_9BACT|nr:hypothetical protein [Hymenobacter negativus]MBO2009865.1 hypothetical protein [Hymenobacter negativus]